LWRGPAVASLGPFWSPWGKPRPLQWPPDPQGPWQRPPVGWGWYGAVCRACECRKATRSGPPRPFVFLFFLRPLKNRNPRATASKIVLCSALRCLSPRDPGSRGDRHLKAEQSTIFDAVAQGFRFFSGRNNKKKKKGRGGPLRVGIAAFTCPTHGPIPPPTHRRPLPGPLRVGWPLQGPWLTPRAPQRPRRGHGRPSAH